MSTARKERQPVRRLATENVLDAPVTHLGDEGVELPAAHTLEQGGMEPPASAVVVKLEGNAGDTSSCFKYLFN